MCNLEFGLRSWLFPKGGKQLVAQRAIIELFNVEPKVTDRVDAVDEVGASE